MHDCHHKRMRTVTNTHTKLESSGSGRALSAYLLGTLEFDALLSLQRRLVYEISGDRQSASLIICDHPPGITIGREGSRSHVRPSPEKLNARRWPVRWVSRGGGTMLHLPGQVACYPIIPLDVLGLTVAQYVGQIQDAIVDLLKEYGLVGNVDPIRPGVCVKSRRIAHVGVAVRDNVTCFGLLVNADPDLELFRDVRCDGDSVPMTSLQREYSGRVRVSGVRQRLLELIASRFALDRVSVFHTHPGAMRRPTRHAAAQHS